MKFADLKPSLANSFSRINAHASHRWPVFLFRIIGIERLSQISFDPEAELFARDGVIVKRVKDLISDIRIRYPADDFFAGVEISLESSLVRDHYNAYEKAFEVLDATSWTILKEKAISHFNDERSGQRKQAFFNVLNEAFACQWLMHHGFSQVKVIAENRKRTPDISYVDETEEKFCEVKTIGISDDEIFRRSSQKAFDGSAYLN